MIARDTHNAKELINGCRYYKLACLAKAIHTLINGSSYTVFK
jgi:hypothetical protein